MHKTLGSIPRKTHTHIYSGRGREKGKGGKREEGEKKRSSKTISSNVTL